MRLVYLTFLLLASLGCYQIGGITGVFAVVVLGMVLEALFWYGVFKRRKK